MEYNDRTIKKKTNLDQILQKAKKQYKDDKEKHTKKLKVSMEYSTADYVPSGSIQSEPYIKR